MLLCQVNDRTELRLVEFQHAAGLFALIDANREHLRRWHGWVDSIRTTADLEKCIGAWHQQMRVNGGFQTGIWHDDRLCGMIGHLHTDSTNRWTAITYWMDAAHQGKGIMTACCRSLVLHSFQKLKLNRVTIECATANLRSRAIPERLGFTLEGVIRRVEWLHDHHVDHAIYGLLHSDEAVYELRNTRTGSIFVPSWPDDSTANQLTCQTR